LKVSWVHIFLGHPVYPQHSKTLELTKKHNKHIL